MRRILFLFISLIILTGCNKSTTSDAQQSTKSPWTLFVYTSDNQVEDTFSGYASLADCWDGAVTATNRGQKYFECGRNCGDFTRNKYTCDFVCAQYQLDDCEERLE